MLSCSNVYIDAIGNTEDDVLYQSDRWGGSFSYEVPLPEVRYCCLSWLLLRTLILWCSFLCHSGLRETTRLSFTLLRFTICTCLGQVMGRQIAAMLTLRSTLVLSRFTQPGIRVFDVTVEGDLFEDIDVVRTELLGWRDPWSFIYSLNPPLFFAAIREHPKTARSKRQERFSPPRHAKHR
jgi:hypothetical protein